MIELWALWGVLAVFVVAYAVRGLVDTRNIFAPPLIVSLLVFGVLVISYSEFDDMTLAVLLDTDYYLMTLMYAALCLFIFCLCYETGLRSPRKASRHPDIVHTVPLGTISIYVTIVAIIGLAAQIYIAQRSGGLVEFYSQAHGSAGRFDEISGYIHGLPNFLWPVLLISYIVWTNCRSRYLLLLLIIVAAALFAHTFLFGNRNGIIRFCIMLGGAYVFIHRPSLTRAIPLIGVLLLGIAAVLVAAEIRKNLHLGSDVSLVEALAEYSDEREQNQWKRQMNLEAGGHELFFNVAVVQAASETGTYDYGAQYVYPIINFVPRFLWPSKPYEVEFVVDYFALTSGVTGWNAGAGAAPNSISMSFLAFSWFGWIPWGVFGLYCGRTLRAARDAPTLMNLGALISCLLACIYWGTQAFSAVFFAWFFTIIPFYGLQMLALRRAPSLHQSTHRAVIRARQ